MFLVKGNSLNKSLELAEFAANCFQKHFKSHPLNFKVDVKVNEDLKMGPVYSPRLDVAVGPFAIYERLEEKCDRVIRSCSDFIDNCIGVFHENYNRFAKQYD